jgi:subtilisin family serine protease
MMVGMITVVLVCWAGSGEAVYRGPTPDTGNFVRGAERFGPEALGQQRAYKPGELLVRFAPKPNGRHRSRAEKNGVLSAIGAGNIKRSYRLVPGLTVVKLPGGLTVEKALKRFKRRAEVLYAEPNYEVKALVEPNDTWFIALWGMHNESQSGGTTDADIDAPEAWDLETDANEIIVAVIDSGVDYNHVDLSANMWTDANGCYGYDFVNDDNDPMDDRGHGTHCAGTIGAVGDNNEGVTGVCWDVKIMAVKFLNSYGVGYTDDAIAAIGYAVDNGADVLSNSWGGGGYSEGLKDAIEAADANGVLFVAAAGNDSRSNDIYPHYPSSYDCNNIISVLSTDKYDQMSGFSNYGPTSVDLGAPGSTIYSCKLGGGYTYGSGTSMATPHVAGACALVWAEHPSKSCLEVKETVVWTADELDDLDANCVTSGRLNLYRALADKKVKNVTQAKWYDAIQDALDEANDLDLIRVRPGTYYENVDFNGVCCTLTSINPDDPCVVAATIIDANGSGTVVTFFDSEDANAVLTGFTITGGYKPIGYGGGIFCRYGCPIVSNCVIRDNYGYYAGGMYIDYNSPDVINCTFSGNSAYMQGGGLWIKAGSPNVQNCTFTGNTSTNFGGGLNIQPYYASPVIDNCVFTNNTAGDGGGISQSYSSATIKNCVFSGNRANYGGAIRDYSGSSTILNCVFSNNEAGWRGAGIYSYTYASTGNTTLANCTFTGNECTGSGGGMYNYMFPQITLTNCILWNNYAGGSGDDMCNNACDPNVSFCDIKGCGGSGPGWDPNFGTDDGNNIDQDPCFVDPNDPNGSDDIWCTIDDGLELGAGSPCIDAADNDAITASTDIAASVRKRDDPCTTDTGNGTPPIVDMGAYEHLANATIYVDLNATGGVYNGLSWATAFKYWRRPNTRGRGYVSSDLYR